MVQPGGFGLDTALTSRAAQRRSDLLVAHGRCRGWCRRHGQHRPGFRAHDPAAGVTKRGQKRRVVLAQQ
jgi:hypothetical protein